MSMTDQDEYKKMLRVINMLKIQEISVSNFQTKLKLTKEFGTLSAIAIVIGEEIQVI